MFSMWSIEVWRRYGLLTFLFAYLGCVVGSENASERLMDDIMVRKFIEGVFYELLVSDIVIKRRDNQIIVAFYLAGSSMVSVKTYFLVGFSERLLSEMFGCIVKLEIVSQLTKTLNPTWKFAVRDNVLIIVCHYVSFRISQTGSGCLLS